MNKDNTPELFSVIAKNYDFLNHLLSFNLDRAWRQGLVSLPGFRPGDKILDVCTGTGDISIEFARRGEIIEEKALFDHLKAHQKFMAGIDAWWTEPFRHGRFEMRYPFPALPNVVCSPHNSGVVEDSLVEATKFAVENLKSYLEGGELRGVINRKDYL